jgi:NADH-quinone oxidoreductase subunit J
VGAVIGIVALGLIAAGQPLLSSWAAQAVFWLLAFVTVSSAAAAVAMQSPVYSAIWFAMSLLGTAGLFLYDGAQFLGVATVMVYAGAIVVTLLFVVMLAQPEGHATYDRISWGWYTKLISALSGAVLVGVLSVTLAGLRANFGQLAAEVGDRSTEILTPSHAARLGGILFGEHLISVEIGGTLLLVALVGAIAIMIQGHQGEIPEPAAGGSRRG